jgi:uncharacterized protein YqiB (DUF1249 family)
MTLLRTAIPRFPRFSRLGWLMGLYAENFQRLERLLPIDRMARGTYVSHGTQGMDLVVEVLETHRYTLELRLSYRLDDPVTGQPDPSAYLRIYRDARQAEVTHCYVGRRWQDVLGMHPAPRVLFGHRLRMNSFLNKWLEFLLEQGHAGHTLVPSVADVPEPSSAACA